MPAQSLSRVQLSATPWTVGRQAPLSMEFSRQEYQSGLPFPTPRDLPDPGIKSVTPESLALAGGFFTTKPPGEIPCHIIQVTRVCMDFCIWCVCACDGTNLWWIPRDCTHLPLYCVYPSLEKATHEEAWLHLAFTLGLFLSRVLDI